MIIRNFANDFLVLINIVGVKGLHVLVHKNNFVLHYKTVYYPYEEKRKSQFNLIIFQRTSLILLKGLAIQCFYYKFIKCHELIYGATF